MGDVSSISGKLPVLYDARPSRPVAVDHAYPPVTPPVAVDPASTERVLPSDGLSSAGISSAETHGAGRSGERPRDATGAEAGGRAGGGEEGLEGEARRRAAATGRALVPLSRVEPGVFADADEASQGVAVADGLRRRVAIAAYENASRGPTGGPLLTDVKI